MLGAELAPPGGTVLISGVGGGGVLSEGVDDSVADGSLPAGGPGTAVAGGKGWGGRVAEGASGML